MNKEKAADLFVCFHIMKGGMPRRSGHKVFLPRFHSLHDVIRQMDYLYLINEDDNGNPLPDAAWYVDCCGIDILHGREAIEAVDGTLDINGDDDTYIVKPIKDCDEEEMRLIMAYLENEQNKYDQLSKRCS